MKEVGFTPEMKDGLEEIMKNKQMIIEEPSPKEKVDIQTRFEYSLKKVSHYDRMKSIFKQLNVPIKYHHSLIEISQRYGLPRSDDDALIDFVQYSLRTVKD